MPIIVWQMSQRTEELEGHASYYRRHFGHLDALLYALSRVLSVESWLNDEQRYEGGGRM